MQIAIEDVDPDKLRTFKEELNSLQSAGTKVSKKLSASTCAIVDQLREKGFAAEHVIVFMRQVCLNVGLSSQLYRTGEWNGHAARNLVDKIITLCIDRYYEAGPPDGGEAQTGSEER